MTLIALALILGTPAFAGEDSTAEDCFDGLDNDGNGDVDCADPECLVEEDCGETELSCEDEIDNNGDGATDCEDDECAEDDACLGTTESDCSDEEDNDEDGDVDCDDDDCAEDAACLDTTESDCSDEVDNDDDGDMDCDDEDCAEDAACEEACDTADTSTDCTEPTGSGAAPMAGELGGCGCSASPSPPLAGTSVLLLLGTLLFARRRRILSPR